MMRSTRLWAGAVAAFVFAACAPEVPRTGTMMFNLRAEGSGGAYTLCGDFEVSGPVRRVLRARAASPGADCTLAPEPLPVGAYGIRLLPGWTLRLSGGDNVAIAAELSAGDTRSVQINANATSSVVFSFYVDGEELDPPPDTFRECLGDSLAHRTFNAFWRTFDARYAVFDLRLQGTTWSSIGESGCAQISEDMTDDALFDVLLGMAQNLDDGHTSLYAASLDRSEDAQVSLYPHEDQMYELPSNVEARYLNAPFETAARNAVRWGTIGTAGYIEINALEELSPDGDEEDDVAVANQAMATALADLQDARGIVVDIRGNGGGWDVVSLEIAAWFAGGRTVAWSEQVRNGPDHDDLTEPTETFVDATRTGGFSGPVVLLTSRITFSAAETLALAMRVRDSVRLVGERTSGHLSDLFDGSLPNGWEFTFSGERYIAADGQIYEASGVPVDVQADFDPDAFASGSDTMLEAALAEL